MGQAVIIRRNTPACGVAETYSFPSCFVASGGLAKFFPFDFFVRQLAILQFTGWYCAICGSLLVLAICDFRCAVDVSAPVFRIFHLDYHLR